MGEPPSSTSIELPSNVRQEMQFTLADRIEDVLRVTLPEVAGRLQPAGVG